MKELLTQIREVRGAIKQAEKELSDLQKRLDELLEELLQQNQESCSHEVPTSPGSARLNSPEEENTALRPDSDNMRKRRFEATQRITDPAFLTQRGLDVPAANWAPSHRFDRLLARKERALRQERGLAMSEAAGPFSDTPSSQHHPPDDAEATNGAEAVPAKCQIPADPFSGKYTTSIRDLWNEYTVGIKGQPSIQQLECDHGNNWKYWKKKNEELVFDPDKDYAKGKITRLATEPEGCRKDPCKTREQWRTSWYRYCCVTNRLKLYVEVLMGTPTQMSEHKAGDAACRILEREMADSGIRSLKVFLVKHLQDQNTKAMKQDKDLPEKLKKRLAVLDNAAATST